MVIFVFIVLQLSGLLGWIGAGLARAITPIFTAAYDKSLTIRNWTDAYREPGSIIDERDRLEKELAATKNQLNSLQTYRNENENLRQVADYRDSTSLSLITAKIATRWDFAGETYITIDKGSNDGVESGDLVVDENGKLVGKVNQAGQSISDIQLLTHPNFKIAVKKAEDVSAIGLLNGRFMLTAEVDLIPQEAQISVGDELVTANLQGVVEGLRVGEISEINSQKGSLFKKAIVVPLYDLDRLIYLQVVKQDYGN